MRASFLPAVLRSAGLTVIEHGIWEGRGGEMASIDAVIIHETITQHTTSDRNVANLLRDGHSKLRGPLSQLGLDRSGRFWLIADGKCNHNGYGQYGNNTIGIEAFNDGEQPWSAAQRSAAERGTAAILQHLGLPTSRCLGHKESDPGRKVDPHFDMAPFRSAITEHQTGDDIVTPQDKDEIVMRVVAELKPLLDKALNSLAGYATGADGKRTTARSAVGRIEDYVRPPAP